MARKARGFTLLEVLVAFTILAVGLTALMQAFSTGLGGVTRSAAQLQTVLAARSVLEQLGPLIPLDPGEIQGATGEGFAYAIKIEPLASLEGVTLALMPVETMRVTVTLSGPGGTQMSLSTLRLRPRT